MGHAHVGISFFSSEAMDTNPAAPIGLTEVQGEFEAGYIDNHGGTFNGSIETINTSMEKYFHKLIADDGIQLSPEDRSTAGKKFRYLLGVGTHFIVSSVEDKGVLVEVNIVPKDGQRSYVKRRQSRFTYLAERVLHDLLDHRNGHVHKISLYPMLENFVNLTIPVGGENIMLGGTLSQTVLTFNPTNTLHSRMYFVKNNPAFSVWPGESHCLATVHNVKAGSLRFDFEECELNYADLTLECLTQKQFEYQFPNIDIGEVLHAVVIYYGRRTFYIPISKRENAYLRQCWSYEPGGNWKTHYFRFKGDALMSRICENK